MQKIPGKYRIAELLCITGESSYRVEEAWYGNWWPIYGWRPALRDDKAPAVFLTKDAATTWIRSQLLELRQPDPVVRRYIKKSNWFQ